MPLSKIQAQSINLADTFAFTGTVSGVGGIVPLTTVTAGSSTTDLDWTGASSTYDNYLVFYDIDPSADADIRMRFFDSSNSIVSTNSYGYGTIQETAASNATSNSTSALSLRVSFGGNGADEKMSGFFWFLNPKVSTKKTSVNLMYNGENTGGSHIGGVHVGSFTSETEQNGFRIYVSTGNLDGSTAQIYGIVKP